VTGALGAGGIASAVPAAPPEPAVVDHPRLLTPEWLTAALRAGGHDATVRGVRHEPVGTGQMAASHRLHLDLAPGAGPDVPTSLVAKLPTPDVAARSLVGGAYHTEAAFYAEIAPTVAIRVPACHHHAIADDHATFTLLLEDMAPATQGDQIAGCTAEEARRAAVNLAGLHGPRWSDPTLHDHDWLLAPDAEGAVLLREILVSATDAFVDRYGPRMARDDVATLRAVAEAIGDWVLGRTTPYGLVHGDYRLDNLLFASVGGSADAGANASGDAGAGPAGVAGVAAVDWQTVSIGLPGRDIAYLLGTGLDPGERRRYEDDLVAAYHAALVGHGVAGYSLDDCLADYRYGAVQGPLVTVLGAAYGAPTDRGDDMFMTMAARSCAQVRDLATLDLV